MTNAGMIVAAVSLPHVANLGAGRVVTVQELSDLDGMLIAEVVYTIDGEPQTFSNPWKIVHPPILTAAGDEDPAAAFGEMIATAGWFRG